jgi:arylformamidase
MGTDSGFRSRAMPWVAAIAAVAAAVTLLARGRARGGDEANPWDLKGATVIDLSHVSEHEMPVADPALIAPTYNWFSTVGSTLFSPLHNLETVHFCPHTGTHMDSPFHVNNGWGAVETVDPTVLIGPAAVLSLSVRAGSYAITPADIKGWEAKNGAIRAGDGVLIHTGHDANWPDKTKYITNGYPHLAPEAAQYLVDRKVRYVGIESISPDANSTDSHKILLGHKVAIIENVTNIGAIGKARCNTVGTFANEKGASGVHVRLLAVTGRGRD